MGLVQPVLKGRLRGNAVGLVQLFGDVPCPDILARRLLLAVLSDFFETGHHYLLHLARWRDEVWINGTTDQVEALDKQIREYHVHQQIPWRKKLDFLFSQAGYEKYGIDITAFWAATLLQLVTLEQYWEDIVLGYKPKNPSLRPGFHADEDVYSTEWLEDFRPGWSEELLAALPCTESVEEEAHAYRETEPAEHVADVTADTADAADPWVH